MMRRTKSLWIVGWLLLGCLIALGCFTAAQEAELPSHTFDVVIVSGSSSGVGAALGAARLGVTVALIEPDPVPGGMLANGIGNVDEYSVQALSGVYREFTDRVRNYYRPIMATDPVFKEHWTYTLPPALLPPGAKIEKRFSDPEGVMDPDQGGRWEMHVADQIFKQMLAEQSNIKVFYKRHATRVIKEGNRVIGVETCASTQPNAYAPCEPGTDITFYGSVIVDATPEGDIAAWAGVPYLVGREARSRLEPHAGSIYYYDETGEILPGGTGEQDRAVVSYGLRINIQNYDERDYRAHLLPSAPPGYDKAAYEHSAYDSAEFNPRGKAEVNMMPFGNELQEMNWTWPEASREERERQYELFKNHALGFLYYLQHVRGLHVGLPTDDFTDNGGVPYQIYVREARRIVGEYTMTEADIVPFITGRGRIQPVVEDAIGVGHDPLDSKPLRLKTDLSTPDKGEGDFYVNVVEPFQVPYRAIVPKQIDGLLVPTAMSATHVAFSAIRLDPGWTVIGQAAGVAAALSAKDHLEVRSVPVRQIQRELLRQKCELMFYWDLPLDHPAFRAVEWFSVNKIVDGYPDRLFRPDQSLTRAEMAAMVVEGLDMWPSVSNVHFSDVPPESWAFREIETLYDNQALETFGIKPRWPKYGSWDTHADLNAGYGQDYGYYQFFPSRPATWRELVDVIHAASQRKMVSPSKGRELAVNPPEGDPMSWVKNVLSQSTFGSPYSQEQFQPDQPVTRGEACALIAAMTDREAARAR